MQCRGLYLFRQTKQVMHAKVQISDDCKAEYAVEIQKTNEVQRDHYGNTVPQLFNVNICLMCIPSCS